MILPDCKSSVHPRTRGEHAMTDSNINFSCGSSPHSRGTLLYRCECGKTKRFIPALAGNTGASQPSIYRQAVHPRTRGEHYLQALSLPMAHGSSPHSRGTQKQERLALRSKRFIPALAGNTPLVKNRQTPGAVHPRTRGEHFDVPIGVTPGVGSSPHSRGTLTSGIAYTHLLRFIPALAGNT